MNCVNSLSRELSEVKADLPALLAALGLPDVARPGNHHPCPACQDKTALSIFQAEAGWSWRCHRCAAGGTVVDALALTEGCTPAEAIKRLCGPGARTTSSAPRSPAPPPPPSRPVLNKEAAFQFFALAFENILSGAATPWLKKRGILPEYLEQFPLAGFVRSAAVPGMEWPLRNAWILRISDAEGVCIALKAHRENVPPNGRKGSWLPFGTEPAEKPRHGFSTLWPAPEWFSHSEPLFLCPGELKALAVLSAGRAATSPTTGEGFNWPPHELARLRDRRVVLLFDDDKAGHAFRDKTVSALAGVAATLKTTTFGKV